MTPVEVPAGDVQSLVEWRLSTCERKIDKIDANIETMLLTLARMKGGNKLKTLGLNLVVQAIVAFGVVFVERLLR